MIIEYKMADDEIAHLEVDDSLGQIIFELDKYEKNKNRAETRRHTILSLSDKDIKNVDVNEDILNIILKKSNLDKLHIAISKLKPQEQDLIYHLFFKAEPI